MPRRVAGYPANVLSALALLLLGTPEATAASYDPALTWRTLRTDHFEITFHDGEEQLAEEMAEAAEGAWDTLTVELDYTPKRRVQIVLVDYQRRYTTPPVTSDEMCRRIRAVP